MSNTVAPVCHEHSGKSNRDAGQFFGCDGCASPSVRNTMVGHTIIPLSWNASSVAPIRAFFNPEVPGLVYPPITVCIVRCTIEGSYSFFFHAFRLLPINSPCQRFPTRRHLKSRPLSSVISIRSTIPPDLHAQFSYMTPLVRFPRTYHSSCPLRVRPVPPLITRVTYTAMHHPRKFQEVISSAVSVSV